MSYLLDTNVVSEPFKPRPDIAAVGWLEAHVEDTQLLSVLTIGELHRGLARARRRQDSIRIERLARHVATIEEEYSGRIIPVTVDVARAWAGLGLTQPMSVPDGLIAATALVHGLTVVTRNVKDFEQTGVPIINPFAA